MTTSREPRLHSLANVLRVVMTEALVLLFLAVAAVWLIWRQQNLADATACQVRYNTAFAKIQANRAALSDADRLATLTLITEAFTPPKRGETAAQENAALMADYQRYKAAEAAVTAGRARNPVPGTPHC